MILNLCAMMILYWNSYGIAIRLDEELLSGKSASQSLKVYY